MLKPLKRIIEKTTKVVKIVNLEGEDSIRKVEVIKSEEEIE